MQMTSTPTTTRQISLASRPHGEPTPENFRLETVALPEPADGEILVRNTLMSVDPYMRGRMNDAKSYVAPFRLDEPLDGGAVGEVIASRSADVPVGTHVVHGLGWREHVTLPAAQARVIDTEAAPASAYLGVLGMPGVTAYVGLTAVAARGERVGPGEAPLAIVHARTVADAERAADALRVAVRLEDGDDVPTAPSVLGRVG